MKTKNIPADIKIKSIKEAQNEIKEIISKLERTDSSLENSIDQYERMLALKYHIQKEFKKKDKEINICITNTQIEYRRPEKITLA